MINRVTPVQKQVAEFIKQCRGELTIAQFSLKCGVSKGRLGEYERGEYMPTIERLDRIARCVGKKVVITFEEL